MLNATLKDLKIHWNAKPMLSAADRAIEKSYKRFGAYTRKVAKNSIKTRSDNDYSRPGEVPHGHTFPTRYKDWIFFNYDRAAKVVVIGALPLARRDNALVPKTLEYGGWSTRKPPREEFANWKRWMESKKRVAVFIEERLHMRPAYNKVVAMDLPGLLANSITPT